MVEYEVDLNDEATIFLLVGSRYFLLLAFSNLQL